MRRNTTQSNRTAQNSTTRRTFLKATAGAGAVTAGFGAGLVGTAGAAGINTPALARDGNKLVDPSGNEIILRGVSIADPGEQARSWRGQTAEETFELATDTSEGWYNRIIRIPIGAEFVAAGVRAPDASQMPHGDDWGPLLPGQYGQSELDWYLSEFIDGLVDLGQQRGAYVMIDYHRHYPVFHQMDHQNHGVPEDIWICSSDGGEDWRFPEVCGERGLLWHGEDQVDAIMDLVDEQNIIEAFDDIEDESDIYLEPPEITNALDDELQLFWSMVADRYADDDHVVFDIYNEPTGPYGGDWGGPQRQAGELSQPAVAPGGIEGADYDVRHCEMKHWYDLWRDRAQPWVDAAENNGPGHILTIGNPRWSQYVNWAPYNEFDAEHMCYTSHVYTQDDLRPLSDYVGEASESVPIFFSEFGWIEGGGLLVDTPWMDCSGDIGGGDCTPYIEEYGEFLDTYDVHPICWSFDHTWEPNFFDHGEPGQPDGAPSADNWMDHLLDTTPGQWWLDRVQAVQGDRDQPVSGSQATGTDTGPNSLHMGAGIGPGIGESCGDGECDNPIQVGSYQACDPNGNGLYTDVNGNGGNDFDDVVTFFDEMNSSGVQNNVSAFDFNDNGGIDFDDVVALFNQV